ncbi:hypothetical protein [Micromonospora sp. ATA51]|uniref:hypothetical protein n=1 Tax=Micromonospora sp. ATA51 TaxID=2806098 RepID=UPI001EE4E1A3|nr:hypothetical protein [Micromonospora sp. ATA51]
MLHPGIEPPGHGVVGVAEAYAAGRLGPAADGRAHWKSPSVVAASETSTVPPSPHAGTSTRQVPSFALVTTTVRAGASAVTYAYCAVRWRSCAAAASAANSSRVASTPAGTGSAVVSGAGVGWSAVQAARSAGRVIATTPVSRRAARR